MTKLIFVIRAIAGMIADFLYAPLIRAHLREIALKAPLFPGQVWFLPMLGRVRILTVSDTIVGYRAIDADDELYHCSRRDFVILGKTELDDDRPAQVIPFKIHTQKDIE